MLQARDGGVRFSLYLNREAKPPEVLEQHADRVGFHRADPMPLHPKGGNFSIKAVTNLLPAGPGLFSLALVTLGDAELKLGDATHRMPSLNRTAWPASYRVSAHPQGSREYLHDRILSTRWTTGRAKKKGDWIQVDLPEAQRVHGVVLDSAPSGMRDCPMDFSVSLDKGANAWNRIAELKVPQMAASTVDAMFPPQPAKSVKIENRGTHGSLWWSVHELHLITDKLLDRIAVKTRLGRSNPLQITYRPPPEETEGAAGGFERDYSLLRMYWKPPGQNWQPVPGWAFGAGGSRLLPGWAFTWLNEGGRLLPWMWALLLALWIVRLWPASKSGQAQPGGRVDALPYRLMLAAGVLLLVTLLDDFADTSGLFRFWSTMVYGPHPEPYVQRSWLWTAGAAGLALAAALLLRWRRPRLDRGLFAWGVAAMILLQAGLVIVWLQALGLEFPLTNNDHGNFQYSHAIWEHTLLPFIHYNPFWNAGITEWEPVRNGSFSAFVLARPLTWFLPIQKAYTLFTPIIFVILLPWIGFASLRASGAGRTGSLLGGLILIMPHSNWAFWLSMGASAGLISAALTLPALAFFWRLVENRGSPWLNALIASGAFSLGLFWMPSVFAACIPCLGLFALHAGQFRDKPAWGLGLLSLCILLLSLPWILDFMAHFEVGSFTMHSLSLRAPKWPLVPHRLWTQTGELNPLLLFAGLCGLPLLGGKKRIFIIAYTVYLLLTTTLIRDFFHGYQLGRMQQFYAIALMFPAARLLDQTPLLLRERNWSNSLAFGGLAACICLQAVIAFNFYSDNLNKRGLGTAPLQVMALANYLARADIPDGRILLAGKTRMQYGGSAAYLQLIIKRPMIADYHVATLNKKLEVKLPPELCIRPPSAADFKHLLMLYNVTRLVKDQQDPGDKWNRYLEGLDFLAPSLKVDKRFQVYKTRFEPSWLLEGRAKVRADFNRITVEPLDSGPLVLKFCFEPGLQASGAVKLRPVKVWQGVNFIGCSGHGGKPFCIEFE